MILSEKILFAKGYCIHFDKSLWDNSLECAVYTFESLLFAAIRFDPSEIKNKTYKRKFIEFMLSIKKCIEFEYEQK